MDCYYLDWVVRVNVIFIIVVVVSMFEESGDVVCEGIVRVNEENSEWFHG